jgi:chemosensory pili system protein ChpA (sensor histidine kinase/response regulator)
VIQAQYPAWRNDRSNQEALSTMRRSYHTLKGSGRLVGATNIGEFAWSIENLLNRVIDGTISDSDGVTQVLDDALEVLPTLVAEAKTMMPNGLDVSALSARAFALAAGEVIAAQTIDDETADAELIEEVQTVEQTAAEPLPEVLEPEPGDESILTATETEDSQLVESVSLAESADDTSLSIVFLAEAGEHIAVLGDFLQRRASDPQVRFDDGLRRAMHTLRGCSTTAGIDSMADMAGTLEELGNVMVSLSRPVDDDLHALLARAHDTLGALAASVELPTDQTVVWEPVRDELRVLLEQLSHPAPDLEDQHAAAAAEADLESFDPELLEIFLEEARELLEALETELSDWQAAPGELQAVAQLQRTLHTVKGGARLAGVSAIGDLSHALESVFESLTERRIHSSDELQRLVRHATDVLAQDVEQLAGGHVPHGQPDLLARLEAAARGGSWAPLAASDAMLEPETVTQDELLPEPPETLAEPTVEQTVDVAAPAEDGENQAPWSEELAAIEEAEEIESEAELLTDSQLMTDSELLTDPSYMVDSEIADSQLSGLTGGDSSVVHFPASDMADEVDGFVPRRPMPTEEKPTGGSGERVRVPSEALDQMVNNAGEVSIYRARIEQQNTTFAFNLGELQQTIDRLRSQLRALELETEAQVLSRHERESDSRADFDPLELDRYSTMQQLSRALSETVEDLSNLGHSLTELSRDTDTLLLQQARVNTDLQDSLLRTRMVKFSSRVPRLERVVRQTAHGLGKQAALKVTGGHEDMDRAILERMMSPLEHLLRNAVSHGIEDSNTRLANGKAEEGSISLQLAREGSDIVLTLADDGAGLDRARIRAKAVERGLIEAMRSSRTTSSIR